jgi:hypothetical protein
MAGGKKLDRRGSGPGWFVMLAVLTYFLYSVAAAAATASDCGDRPKEWRFFPPGYECVGRPGFG